MRKASKRASLWINHETNKNAWSFINLNRIKHKIRYDKIIFIYRASEWIRVMERARERKSFIYDVVLGGANDASNQQQKMIRMICNEKARKYGCTMNAQWRGCKEAEKCGEPKRRWSQFNTSKALCTQHLRANARAYKTRWYSGGFLSRCQENCMWHLHIWWNWRIRFIFDRFLFLPSVLFLSRFWVVVVVVFFGSLICFQLIRLSYPPSRKAYRKL